MVSFYAASSEPARRIRGKAVYLQYSTRQEITSMGSKGRGEGGGRRQQRAPGDYGNAEAKDVSIGVLHDCKLLCIVLHLPICTDC